ncbi:hypothetical protein ACTWPB_26810 [Nocardia sp. IBHARD005]|uniref:hypothetical protein n=1 Tax=Nocardia sp. IBHARD005 TaxID=3457765 RepID=UPI004059E3F1
MPLDVMTWRLYVDRVARKRELRNTVLVNGSQVTAALIAAGVTTVLGWLAAQRAQYDRVKDVVAFIAAQEVSAARHRLGLFIHGAPNSNMGQEERVRDLFTVLWAFSQVNAVRATLSPRSGPLSGPHRLLQLSVGPWAKYWVEQLELEYGKSATSRFGHGIDIDGSDVGLRELQRAWFARPPAWGVLYTVVGLRSLFALRADVQSGTAGS